MRLIAGLTAWAVAVWIGFVAATAPLAIAIHLAPGPTWGKVIASILLVGVLVAWFPLDMKYRYDRVLAAWLLVALTPIASLIRLTDRVVGRLPTSVDYVGRRGSRFTARERTYVPMEGRGEDGTIDLTDRLLEAEHPQRLSFIAFVSLLPSVVKGDARFVGPRAITVVELERGSIVHLPEWSRAPGILWRGRRLGAGDVAPEPSSHLAECVREWCSWEHTSGYPTTSPRVLFCLVQDVRDQQDLGHDRDAAPVFMVGLLCRLASETWIVGDARENDIRVLDALSAGEEHSEHWIRAVWSAWHDVRSSDEDGDEPVEIPRPEAPLPNETWHLLDQ